MDYLKLLENSYKQNKKFRGDEELDPLEFLAEDIFKFTTYESVVSSLMAKKCLEVCKAISEKMTFKYIESEEGQKWYLIMVNMPFFNEKLEWGTSIRGAWWKLCGDQKFKVESYGLYVEREQLLEILFNQDEWPKFIDAMVEFASAKVGDL